MRLFFLLLSIFASIYIFSGVALAQVDCGTPDPNLYVPDEKLCNPFTDLQDRRIDTLPGAIQQGLRILTLFIPLTAIIMLVFSGFRMIMAQGDSEAVTKGKLTFRWTLYGFIMSLFAYMLIVATMNYFGATDPASFGSAAPDIIVNPINPKGVVPADDLGGFLVRMLIGFLNVVGLLAVLMLIINGVRYISAQGDSEQLTQAKDSIRWILLGIMIILLAYVLVQATSNFFKP